MDEPPLKHDDNQQSGIHAGGADVLNRQGGSPESTLTANRKGMEPYSTLSSEDVSRLMLEVLAADRRESTGLQSQVKQLMSFLEDAKREGKKQR